MAWRDVNIQGTHTMRYHSTREPEYELFPEWFNIDKRGEFSISVTGCQRIEDLSDAFISKEDLLSKYKTGYWQTPGGNGTWYRGERILAVVTEWQDLLGEDKISTTLKTADARMLLAELTPDDINRFIPSDLRIRVNSERIIDERRERARVKEREREEKEKEERRRALREAQPYTRTMQVTASDLYNLENAMASAVRAKYGVGVDLLFSGSNQKTFDFYKRLLSWPEVARKLRSMLPKKQHKLDQQFGKQLWDNPPGD